MAIFNGREVNILHEVKQPPADPIHITIQYPDGSTEYVPMFETQVTPLEKKTIEKASMTRYDSLKLIEK